MLHGNITSSINGYTVSIFKNLERVFKDQYFQTLSEARRVLAAEKMRISGNFRRSYPELEGKKLRWKHSLYLDGDIQEARVAGCDYDIGITLTMADDLTDNLACYHGPSSVYRKSGKDSMSIENYEKIFIYFLTVMENNIIFDVDFVKLITDRTGKKTRNGMHPCAFVS